MKIIFKDGIPVECRNCVETMLYKDGERAAWLFSFEMNVENSIHTERILTKDNISKIQIKADNSKTYDVGSYENVHSLSVCHTDNGVIAIVELKRGVLNEADKE